MPHFECGAFNRSATSPRPKTGPKRPELDALCNQEGQDKQDKRHARDKPGPAGVYFWLAFEICPRTGIQCPKLSNTSICERNCVAWP